MIAFVLFTGLECFAQKLEPCAPTYVLDRNVESMRAVYHMDGQFFDNFRLETSNLINQISGKYYPPTKDGMDSILAHSVLVDQESFVIPADYWNGARVGTFVVFQNLLGKPSKYWLAYKMPNQENRPFMKADCMNLERKKVPFSTVTPGVTTTTNGQPTSVTVNVTVNVRMPKFIIVYGRNSPEQSQPSGGWSIRPRSDYNYNYPRPCNQGGVIYCKGQQSQPPSRYSRPLPEYNQRTGGSWSQGTPGGAPSIGGSPGGAPTVGGGRSGGAPSIGGSPGGAPTHRR